MVGGGAQERLVTPGEGRTLSTLAGDDRRMNARFEETPRRCRNPPARLPLVLNLLRRWPLTRAQDLRHIYSLRNS